MNTFSYALQQPTTAADPFGQISIEDILNPEKFLKKLPQKFLPHLFGDDIGNTLGEKCGSDCKALTNPRQPRSEAISEICFKLVNELSEIAKNYEPARTTEGGQLLFHSCSKRCSELATLCDKKLSCVF